MFFVGAGFRVTQVLPHFEDGRVVRLARNLGDADAGFQNLNEA